MMTSLSPADQTRARELARMKRVALGLLVVAAIIFIIFRRLETEGSWEGYIRAMAEAAMVGALADWFAVTALFRHPLRIPIPHTAIIPTRKEALGRSLGEFVHGNFLTPDMVAEKVSGARPAQRLADWLAAPDNQNHAADRLMSTVAAGLDMIDDDKAGPAIAELLGQRLGAVDAGTTIATFIDALMDGGHQQVLYDATVDGARGFLIENKAMLRRRLEEESPWYAPEFVNERVFDRIYRGVTSYLDDIRSNPAHELRVAVDAKGREIAEQLRHDPELRARATEVQQRLLDHPEFAAWAETLWRGIKAELERATDDPTSAIQQRTRVAIADFASRLHTDVELQAKIDEWVVQAARMITERGGGEVGELIANTVQRWDPTEASNRIELAVGKDLQYIRINGTIVGGLAGLAIHAFGELL